MLCWLLLHPMGVLNLLTCHLLASRLQCNFIVHSLSHLIPVFVLAYQILLTLPMSFWTFSYIYFHMDVFSFALFPFNQEYHHTSEKAMAPHSSTLAWKTPWMEEPGRLQSKGSRRVRHDLVTSLSLFTFMHWRRKWQPTPVFLPGESQGWGAW